MVKLNTISEMFKLYLGGYKRNKILSVDLNILLSKQNHSEEGKKKLKELWPIKLEEAQKQDLINRELAKDNCDKRMIEILCTRSKLWDLISKQNKKVGEQYHQPILLGEQND